MGPTVVATEDIYGAAGTIAAELEGATAAAVWATSSLDSVIAVIACLIARVTAVPISPDAGLGEVHHILRDSRAELFVGSDPGTDLGIPVLPVDAKRRRAFEPPPQQASRAAFVLYTSGTTGRPKGVPISEGAIAANLDALFSCWAWSPSDRLVHALPLFHVHGLILGVLGPLRIGGSLHHTLSSRPARLAEAVCRGGTLLFGVPTHYGRLAAVPSVAAALSSARLCVSGSAPLPRPVSDALASATGRSPVERYGTTETLICAGVRHDGERRTGYVGPPLDGVSVRLIGEDGAEVPADDQTPGELYVAGPSVFGGYLNLPDVSADVLRGGWYRSGDVATLSSDGYLRLLGRSSVDIIKSGGFKIGALEVEAVLLGHPSVAEAAVIGVPDEDLGERVVAYVVGESIDTDALVALVANELAAHKRPRQVVVLTELPKNAMGKVQKAYLT